MSCAPHLAPVYQLHEGQGADFLLMAESNQKTLNHQICSQFQGKGMIFLWQ